MTLDIEYRCISCCKEKPESYDGMVCEVCGSDYRPIGALFGGHHSSMEPHYERAIGEHCDSFSDKEKKVKRYNKMQKELPPEMRDRAHPEGVCFTQDSKKWREMKDWKKMGKDMQREARKDPRNKEKNDRKKFNEGRGRVIV